MAKKDLTGGMANLLSGADKTITENFKQTEDKKKATPVGKNEKHVTETAPLKEQTSPLPPDLLSTIEDEGLKKELEERLRKKRLVGRGRPRKNDQLGKRSDGYDRTSLIINKEKWAKLKEIAFIETLTMKEIVELALDMVIERYEAKHGTITPTPERQKDIKDIFF